jgi:phosphoglycerate dehydrogenase-like enzyme
MERPVRLLLADAPASRFGKRVRNSPAARSFELILAENETPEALLAAAPRADAILCYQAPVGERLMAAAPELRLIQKHGVNCKNIDLAAATRRGVRVATLPLMRSITVAEHALALMLACARKLVAGHRAVIDGAYRELGLEPAATSQQNYRGNWARIPGMAELYQTTAGIVGMGDIGTEIAKRCRAFGMPVVYYQRTPHPPDVEAALGIRHLPLDELLSAADHVVLALPHTPETEGLIGARELARMKPTATLVNVGRGGLVDEDALVAALRAGRIAMAGLDVYRVEPLPVTSPLLQLSNVVLLPHLGGGSYRGWEIDLPAALRNIRRFFDQGTTDGIINA